MAQEDGLEEYTGGKKLRRKALLINESLSHMSKAQVLQANLLMSMQVGSRGDHQGTDGVGLGKQFQQASQSNTALI